MSEYQPERDGKDFAPVPKCKPTKDPKVEEDAILEIMTLAIYGAATKAVQDGADVYESNRKVFELFKDAKLVK